MSIQELIQKYDLGSYYNIGESQLRKFILDDFWGFLGWDMNNEQMLPFYKQEVAVEENLKGKFPDYSFRNTSKETVGNPSLYFFVEAKEARQDLYNHLYQAMSYGYSGTTLGGYPLVILFNFEKLLILDCTQKPDLTHSKEFLLKNKILKEWSKDEYETNWQEIIGLLGREAVKSGSLDKLLKEKASGDRFVSLDKSFLADFWSWHHTLTAEIINSNPKLQFKKNNSKTATETATRILNRLVFLKVCEDRETENQGKMYQILVDTNYTAVETTIVKKPEENLLFSKSKNIVKDSYKKFLKLCEDFHIKYNSDLFDIDKDKNQKILISGEQYQNFSYWDLKIGDQILQKIIESLNNSPYIFSIIPVEVLGYIYEQFLAYKQKFDYETGKTTLEEDKKKKTNKDEGIFYTPKEIVSFMIEATVDDWQNKTAVDPACGSGTFLIGWYEFLHNKYLEFYIQNSGEYLEKDLIKKNHKNEYRLTLETKKRIITEQVFGVDMDREAVEIAKLSLCLKVLEGESNDTIDEEKIKHGEPALPTLFGNVKSGNSLLDTRQGAEMFFAETEKEYKLQPFLWNEEFKNIFDTRQGFDYVFANPPYISMKKFPKGLVNEIYKDFLLKNYTSFTKKSDIYCCFFELVLRKNGILRDGGKISFITSSTYFAESSFLENRKLLFDNNILYYSIPCGDIFLPRATVSASVIGVQKNNPTNPAKQNLISIYEGKKVPNKQGKEVIKYKQVSKVNKKILQKFDVLLTKVDKKTLNILEKVSSFIPFGDICETQYGCATGDNKVWLRDKIKGIARKNWLEKNIKIFGTENQNGEEKVCANIKDYYKGQHISRYYLHKTQYEVNYLPAQMKRHKSTARPGDIDDRFEKIKIIGSLVSNTMEFMVENKKVYSDIGTNIIYLNKEKECDYLIYYILAILNSRLTLIFINLLRSNINLPSGLLKKLTIPTASMETQREISGWVHKLTDLYDDYYKLKENWEDKKLREEEARLVRVEYELDKRICDLYGVNYQDLD